MAVGKTTKPDPQTQIVQIIILIEPLFLHEIFESLATHSLPTIESGLPLAPFPKEPVAKLLARKSHSSEHTPSQHVVVVVVVVVEVVVHLLIIRVVGRPEKAALAVCACESRYCYPSPPPRQSMSDSREKKGASRTHTHTNPTKEEEGEKRASPPSLECALCRAAFVSSRLVLLGRGGPRRGREDRRRAGRVSRRWVKKNLITRISIGVQYYYKDHKTHIL